MGGLEEHLTINFSWITAFLFCIFHWYCSVHFWHYKCFCGFVVILSCKITRTVHTIVRGCIFLSKNGKGKIKGATGKPKYKWNVGIKKRLWICVW